MTQSIVCHLLNLALNGKTTNQEKNKLSKSIVALKWHWQSVLTDLNLNGVTPLIANGLEESGYSDRIPACCWQKMQSDYRQSRMLNTFLFLTVYRIIQALKDAKLNPVAGTNIALADSFYADPGERPLKSIDLLLSMDEIPQSKTILKSLGFNLVAHAPGSGHFHFSNCLGIICHLQGTTDKDLLGLTTEIQPQHIQLPSLTVLEPNAMLVELISKMSDRSLSGVSLQSIADLALLFHKWGHLLEPHRLQMLMPESDRWECLWRAVRYLETQLDGQIPSWLSQSARHAQPTSSLETRKLPHFSILPSQSHSSRRLALQTKDLVLQLGK